LCFIIFIQLTSLAGQGGVTGSGTQPPEERYRSQLEQLTAMGFINREANIQGIVFNYFCFTAYQNLNLLKCIFLYFSLDCYLWGCQRCCRKIITEPHYDLNVIHKLFLFCAVTFAFFYYFSLLLSPFLAMYSFSVI
jgi:hypothetical protein